MAFNIRRQLGQAGEQLAVELIENAGLDVIETNWRAGRVGEIDIVARDGNQVVIIEVRTRIGNSKGSALESVGQDKLSKLRILSVMWKEAHRVRGRLRVDIIAITIEPRFRNTLRTLAMRGEKLDIGTYQPHVEWLEAVA